MSQCDRITETVVVSILVPIADFNSTKHPKYRMLTIKLSKLRQHVLLNKTMKKDEIFHMVCWCQCFHNLLYWLSLPETKISGQTSAFEKYLCYGIGTLLDTFIIILLVLELILNLAKKVPFILFSLDGSVTLLRLLGFIILNKHPQATTRKLFCIPIRTYPLLDGDMQ